MVHLYSIYLIKNILNIYIILNLQMSNLTTSALALVLLSIQWGR